MSQLMSSLQDPAIALDLGDDERRDALSGERHFHLARLEARQGPAATVADFESPIAEADDERPGSTLGAPGQDPSDATPNCVIRFWIGEGVTQLAGDPIHQWSERACSSVGQFVTCEQLDHLRHQKRVQRRVGEHAPHPLRLPGS